MTPTGSAPTDEVTPTDAAPLPPIVGVPSATSSTIGTQQTAAARPWHRTKRFWLLVTLLVVVIAFAATAAVATKHRTSMSAGDVTSETSSRGLTTDDASAEIEAGTISNDDVLGWASAPVTVTNDGPERSDYLITVSAETADRKARLESTLIYADDLGPGESTVQTAQFARQLPPDSVVVVTEISRTPAR